MRILESKHFFIVVCLVLVIIQGGVVWNYALNIPYWDDYEAVLKYADHFSTTKDIPHKIATLFEQHGEHRIFLNRVAVLSDFRIRGRVNFIDLIIFGNVLFIVLTGLLYKIFGKYVTGQWIYFLPIPVLLFNLSSYQSLLWATSGIENFGVIFLALLPLYFLFRKPVFGLPDFIAAFVFSILATVSGANGILVFPVGLAGLVLAKSGKWYTGVWALTFLTVMLLYFRHYSLSQYHPIEMVTAHPVSFLSFFVVLTGNIFGGKYLSALLGFLMVLGFIWFAFRYYRDRSKLILLFSLSFIFLSCWLIAFGRTSMGVNDAVTTVRYKIYPELFLVFLYLLYISSVKRKSQHIAITAKIFLAVSIANYGYAAYRYLPQIKMRNKEINCGMASYIKKDNSCALPYWDQQAARQILDRSERTGTYIPEWTKDNK